MRRTDARPSPIRLDLASTVSRDTTTSPDMSGLLQRWHTLSASHQHHQQTLQSAAPQRQARGVSVDAPHVESPPTYVSPEHGDSAMSPDAALSDSRGSSMHSGASMRSSRLKLCLRAALADTGLQIDQLQSEMAAVQGALSSMHQRLAPHSPPVTTTAQSSEPPTAHVADVHDGDEEEDASAEETDRRAFQRELSRIFDGPSMQDTPPAGTDSDDAMERAEQILTDMMNTRPSRDPIFSFQSSADTTPRGSQAGTPTGLTTAQMLAAMDDADELNRREYSTEAELPSPSETTSSSSTSLSMASLPSNATNFGEVSS